MTPQVRKNDKGTHSHSKLDFDDETFFIQSIFLSAKSIREIQSVKDNFLIGFNVLSNVSINFLLDLVWKIKTKTRITSS